MLLENFYETGITRTFSVTEKNQFCKVTKNFSRNWDAELFYVTSNHEKI